MKLQIANQSIGLIDSDSNDDVDLKNVSTSRRLNTANTKS